MAIFAAIASSRRPILTSDTVITDIQRRRRRANPQYCRAIQSLIDRIASTGGGTLVVPEGDFLSGALFFKQGVNLHINKNGILKGSTRPTDYPQFDTRWEGTERKWTSAFLNFDHMTDVVVDGDGMVDGQGDVWMARKAVMAGSGREGVTTRSAATQISQATRPATRFAGRRRAGQTAAHLFQQLSARSHRRLAELQKQAVWCLHVLYSQDVDIQNLNIDAIARISSSDGMDDIDSSKDVRISKCEIACNDDNIAIKSGKDADGLRVNRPSENITISDCTMGVGGGICMGSEVSGGIRNSCWSSAAPRSTAAPTPAPASNPNQAGAA